MKGKDMRGARESSIKVKLTKDERRKRQSRER